MNKYAEATEVINKMAEVKMMMNAHKGNIEDVESHMLLDAMANEMEELAEGIRSGDMINIIEEAADIHNFLIGLVQQQLDRYRSRKNVKSQ